MTSYALFNGDAGPVIVAVWPAGVGHRATTVCSQPTDVQESFAAELCDGLTRLSQALWQSYAASPDDEDDVAAVDLRERGEDMSAVVDALHDPHLPDGTGAVLVSYHPLVEAAHNLGRLLHSAGDAELSAAIAAEVTAEINAVERASLGDLADRAVQAVGLDRADPSPVQVAAADGILCDQPLGDVRLWTSVDPAASCVAAVHWLAAAAEVAGDAVGVVPQEVFAFVDDIEAVSVQVPSLVVAAVLDEGIAPRRVVVDLLVAALKAGDGCIPDPAGLIAAVDAARDQVGRLPAPQRDRALSALLDRVTVLDPRRPGRDLLEHLLDGLNSCLLAFSQSDEEEEWPGASDIGEAFTALVRERALGSAARLV